MSFTLICSLSSQIPGTPAVVRTCHECGTEVWVSLAMQPRVDTGELQPLCQPCAPAATDPDNQYAMIHPDQVAELRNIGILGFAKDVVATFNQTGQWPDQKPFRRQPDTHPGTFGN